jgi:pilus assembly protein CpaF
MIEKTDARFENDTAVQAAVRNIAQSVGRIVDEKNPRLDARLPDGSRVHAVLPPCARNGTTVAIRKFSKMKMSFSDLVTFGALSPEGARFLDVCVYLKKNIIVSGGTGSGKTTLLGLMASRIPKNERLLVIEDASELQINSEHVIFFETRPKNDLGEGEVTIRDLLKSALRLRPDRIIVGEVRGAEAVDLLAAMNTGHGGSMGTVHANHPREALVRLETLAMMDASDIPIAAIRSQVASAIHILVQTSRFSDGTRKVSHISESLGIDFQTGNYITRDLFVFQQTGKDESGKILGQMQPTGQIPSFMREIELNRLPFPRNLFQVERRKDAA